MTILNQEPITALPALAADMIIILIIIGIIAFMVSLFGESFGSMVICLGLLFVALLIAILTPEVSTDRTRYEVILDDNASIVDIYEKYEVIEQCGDIWILEDKEDE